MVEAFSFVSSFSVSISSFSRLTVSRAVVEGVVDEKQQHQEEDEGNPSASSTFQHAFLGQTLAPELEVLFTLLNCARFFFFAR